MSPTNAKQSPINLLQCLFSFQGFLFFLKLIDFLKDFYLFIFRQRGREEEKHQCVVASHTPSPGTWPATQACALIGNGTSDPLGSQTHTQSTELHQPRLISGFLYVSWNPVPVVKYLIKLVHMPWGQTATNKLLVEEGEVDRQVTRLWRFVKDFDLYPNSRGKLIERVLRCV